MDAPTKEAEPPADEEIPSAVEVDDQPLGPGPDDLESDGEDPAEKMPGIPSEGEPPAAS